MGISKGTMYWSGGSTVDNVTHAFAGASIYGLWLVVSHTAPDTSLASAALMASVLGAEAPDSDVLVRWCCGPVAYLRQHRTYSHSIPFWFLYPFLIASGITVLYPHHFGLMYLLGLIGVFSHVGLDVLTSYGTLALWPIVPKRLRMNVLFVVDMVLLGLGFGAIAIRLFGVPVIRIVVWFGSIGVVYILARCWLVHRLTNSVEQVYGTDWETEVIPHWLPWRFDFIARHKREIRCGRVQVHGYVLTQFWLHQPAPSAAVQFAWRETNVGRSFYAFARYPVWREWVDGEVLHITMADAAFRFGQRFPFSAEVSLLKLGREQYALVDEALRAQSVDVAATFAEVVQEKDATFSNPDIPRPVKH